MAKSHTLQFTTVHTKSSQFVCTSRFLVTDPNNALCLRPYQLANVSRLTKLVQLITHRHGPRGKQRSSVALHLLLVKNMLPSSGCCLRSHYLATGLHATI
jgi:hypothetical protein